MASYAIVYRVEGDPETLLKQIRRSWIQKDTYRNEGVLTFKGTVVKSEGTICAICGAPADYTEGIFCHSCYDKFVALEEESNQ